MTQQNDKQIAQITQIPKSAKRVTTNKSLSRDHQGKVPNKPLRSAPGKSAKRQIDHHRSPGKNAKQITQIRTRESAKRQIDHYRLPGKDMPKRRQQQSDQNVCEFQV